MQKIKKMYFFMCFIFSANILFAQNFNETYSPIRNYRPTKTIVSGIVQSYKNNISKINSENKKAVKSIKESLKNLSNEFVSLDSESLIMYSDTISHYLSGITNKIKSHNPSIKDRDLKIFLYRTIIPNASSHGNGIIFVNLDLICKLSSEDELAFILCHEIAHDIEAHVINGLTKRYELFYDKKYQEKLKQVGKQEYNRYKSTDALVTKFLSQYDVNSRENELTADSIGLHLFYNAGYVSGNAVKTIINLDSIDSPLFHTPIDFKSLLNLKGFTFDEEMLNPEKSATLWESNLDYKIPDSLKTHPDCKLRAEALQRIIKNKHLDGLQREQPFADYNYFKTVCTFEYVEHAMNYKYYSYALYCAIELLEKYPSNNYLKCVTSNCYYEIYAAQLRHRFSEIVDFPDKKFPKDYNKLLAFLQNANSSVLKDVCMDYYNENIESLKSNEYADYIKLLINGQDKTKEAFQTDIKSYENSYKNSFYCRQLTEKLDLKKTTKKK